MQEPRLLAISLIEAGQLTEARRELDDAIRRLEKRNPWRLRLTLSILLTRLGDAQGDKQFYEEALRELHKSFDAHEEVYFQRGIVWGRLNEPEKARRAFDASLAVNEDFMEPLAKFN